MSGWSAVLDAAAPERVGVVARVRGLSVDVAGLEGAVGDLVDLEGCGRAEIVSVEPDGLCCMPLAPVAGLTAGTPVARIASRKKAAFLPLLSTRWTCAPGRSANAHATGIAGKPPPAPKSTQTFASGARSMSCNESATCRVQRFGIVAGEIRFVF